MDGRIAVKARIHGRVQGVGFRFSARMEAQRHDVGGWVRNEADGTVSVYAEGEERSVNEYLKWLHQGPPGARVTHVDVTHHTYTGKYHTFSVTF